MTMRAGKARTVNAERGMVVVVALLMLLALAGVGLVGARQVTNEIERTGNYRASKDGSAVTQAGFAAGIALLEKNGGPVLDAMRTRGVSNLDLDEESFEAIELFDMAEGGSFGRGMADEDTDFRNRLSIIGQASVPGYSVGEYVFYRVALTTWGNFGDPTTTGIEQLLTAQKQQRAIMLVGPLAQSQPVQ